MKTLQNWIGLIFLVSLLLLGEISSAQDTLAVFYGSTPDFLIVDIPNVDSTMITSLYNVLGEKMDALSYLTQDGRLLLTWNNTPVEVVYFLTLDNGKTFRVVKLSYFGTIMVPMGLVPAEDVQ